jgi:hypothetical protein
LILGVLGAILFALTVFKPRSSSAQLSTCSDELIDYCWSQGRQVDTSDCTCNPNSCFGITEADCTEQGMYLSYSDCQCHANPSYTDPCSSDPYASGCKRSFDTLVEGYMRAVYNTTGYGGDTCSFESFAWCNHNGGTWNDFDCACSGLPDSGSGAAAACSAAGGTWNSSQQICYNPTGIDDGMQCMTSTDTLYGCVSTGGRWNGYSCKCTH